MLESLLYRIGAKAILLDSDNNILLIQEAPYKENEWSFPGGGAEDDETPKQTILRELQEELGIKDVTLLFKSAHTIKYDWPEEHIETMYKATGKRYKGQEKYQFVVRFNGKSKDIQITPKE